MPHSVMFAQNALILNPGHLRGGESVDILEKTVSN